MHTLKICYRRYVKKKHALTQEENSRIEHLMRVLQDALIRKDTKTCKELAGTLERTVEQLAPKGALEKGVGLILGLGLALCFAVLIRLVWFELYEIPTGSMRPTLKEQDRLTVSKTTFGINIPLSTGHLYFSPDLVERNGIFVFTGEKMDIRDVDTKYFYLFPGKKQYIKRLMGKPGDMLYFYGGLLYGIDKDGNDISSQLQIPRLDLIEHVPFLQFEGKVSTPSFPVNGVYSPVVLRQMNEPLASMSVSGFDRATGKMFSSRAKDSKDISYGELWGINNFGMARILSSEEATQFFGKAGPDSASTATLYMEIRHHPSLENLRVRKDGRGRTRPVLSLSTSFIPIDAEHARKLFENLYTVRFKVKNGVACSYGQGKPALENPFLPTLSNVPDGTYEFYYGKAYKISFQGIALELEKTHPLYEFSEERLKLFYNLGMEFDTRFSPRDRYTPYFPLRYVYFRNGSFYALGAPIFSARDPVLIDFVAKEKELAAAPAQSPYLPFIDAGAPLLPDGSLDMSFIRKYGLTVPEKMYLALGDNHAVSADSREFGFVPQDNLRGTPDFVFWPPGSRFGHPNQPPYPFFNLPRSLIWALAGISICGGLYLQRRRNTIPKL